MKIAIIGGFGYKKTNGQTVKTNNLCNLLAGNELFKVDTANWKVHPFSLLINIKKAFKLCDIIIMLPAQRGVKVFSKLLVHFNKKYKKKIFYDVIGGWIANVLSNNQALRKALMKFNGILVETSTMKNKLNELNLNNVFVVPNYKNILPIEINDLVLIKPNENLKLCTFSRISEKKGITDIINAVKCLYCEGVNVKLDIYGPIEKEYNEQFYELINENSMFCSYCGIIDSDKSVNVLKEYTLLCFPTKSYTEGIPGTIIDAYCAGLPVLASNWESATDVIVDGQTGLLYEFDNFDDLLNKLFYCVQNIDFINKMKYNTLLEAVKYSFKNCQSIIVRCLYGTK